MRISDRPAPMPAPERRDARDGAEGARAAVERGAATGGADARGTVPGGAVSGAVSRPLPELAFAPPLTRQAVRAWVAEIVLSVLDVPVEGDNGRAGGAGPGVGMHDGAAGDGTAVAREASAGARAPVRVPGRTQSPGPAGVAARSRAVERAFGAAIVGAGRDDDVGGGPPPARAGARESPPVLAPPTAAESATLLAACLGYRALPVRVRAFVRDPARPLRAADLLRPEPFTRRGNAARRRAVRWLACAAVAALAAWAGAAGR